MGIFDSINRQFLYDRTELHPGGEDAIKSIREKTPVQLPADYYEFLSCISGAGNPGGMEFEIEVEDEEAGGLSISVCLWSADRAFGMQNEFARLKESFSSKVWFIGTDLGDMVYFYGLGSDGFGIYLVEGGSLGFAYADKVADTLTDFLVHGTGMDVIAAL